MAGAQDKLPVYFDGDRLFLPYGGAASSHILKPPNIRFKGLVENEFFCMSLAKKMGLPVAPVQMFHDCLLVKRYDRMRLDGILFRIHQEDFCQALGQTPEKKYQKRTSNRAVAAIVKRLTPSKSLEFLRLFFQIVPFE